jgi:hypothetical protein
MRTVKAQATAAIEKPVVHAKAQGPIILNGQVLHSITQERLELVNSMSGYVEQNVSIQPGHAATVTNAVWFRCRRAAFSPDSF